MSREPERANAQILERENSDNPFLTPPEAFVKDGQPISAVEQGAVRCNQGQDQQGGKNADQQPGVVNNVTVNQASGATGQ
ncbi:MAG: hypothetical protein WBW75_23475 [Mycobacterium sp.]|uniref:hypothetical protein n=1 Tax=Mycobacterium sp. TaxID=1785 RepID=UPI003C33CFF8